MDIKTTSKYESKFIPRAIAENRYEVEPEHFKKYQAQFLQKKKVLELQVLRENKRQEILQQIIEEKEIDRNRRTMSEQAEKAIKKGKTFSRI